MDAIPNEVKLVLEKLKNAGFEGYAVGGCARDLIMDRTPNDWDIATNAHPEQIQKIFPDSLYENRFGTVTVFICHSGARAEKIPAAQEIQVTTYRVEHGYTDKRHPDRVEFANSLEQDLSRRDFTINAIAIKNQETRLRSIGALDGQTRNPPKWRTGKKQGNLKFPISENVQYSISNISNAYSFFDPYNGIADIQNKLIRAVGNPEDRFDEDALRMMRAVRFAVQLGFNIEENTKNAIKNNAKWMERISSERIRDELTKIIMSDQPSNGIELLRELELLHYIIPELEYGIGVAQNLHHIYTVYQHLILSLKYCPSKKLSVRLAALLHDIAKPKTKQGSGITSTFYNHDYLGAKIARSILRRLKFSNEIIGKTAALVGSHMFFYNVDEVSEAGVRRLVKKIGKENVKDLIDLRIADRLGSGVPKAKPYKLRHLEYMVEKVSKDPISVKMLKIKGNDIMNILNIKPGVKVGAILDVLLSETLDDPSRNSKKYLEKRVKELGDLDLNRLRALAREKIEERKEEEDKTIKRRYWVK